jgi:hypothetical protein
MLVAPQLAWVWQLSTGKLLRGVTVFVVASLWLLLLVDPNAAHSSCLSCLSLKLITTFSIVIWQSISTRKTLTPSSTGTVR